MALRVDTSCTVLRSLQSVRMCTEDTRNILWYVYTRVCLSALTVSGQTGREEQYQ